jgi:hypothetical protein
MLIRMCTLFRARRFGQTGTAGTLNITQKTNFSERCIRYFVKVGVRRFVQNVHCISSLRNQHNLIVALVAAMLHIGLPLFVGGGKTERLDAD